MPNQHPNSSVPWRRRREEYLRASARYDDLIKKVTCARPRAQSGPSLSGVRRIVLRIKVRKSDCTY